MGLSYNGNYSGYTPCRAAILEMEWMSTREADILFNDGFPTPAQPTGTPSATASRMRDEAAAAIATALINDMLIRDTLTAAEHGLLAD
jgi:hypothetical protein